VWLLRRAPPASLTSALVDKGLLVNSLFHYPANMGFLTTPELLENLLHLPFTTEPEQTAQSAGSLPQTTNRNVAQHYKLDGPQYQRVAR